MHLWQIRVASEANSTLENEHALPLLKVFGNRKKEERHMSKI